MFFEKCWKWVCKTSSNARNTIGNKEHGLLHIIPVKHRKIMKNHETSVNSTQNLSRKWLTKLSNMQVNNVKLVRKHVTMPRECFPIVSAWFAAHNSGQTSKNHEKSRFLTFSLVSSEPCWSMSKSHVDPSEWRQTLETRLKSVFAFNEPAYACRMFFCTKLESHEHGSAEGRTSVNSTQNLSRKWLTSYQICK